MVRLNVDLKSHPGYMAKFSPQKNARIGYDAAIARGEKMPWLTTGRELNIIGVYNKHNPYVRDSFWGARDYALRQHKEHECPEGSRCAHRVNA